MRTLVLDACVAIKWYVSESHSDVALALAVTEPQWIVPDLFFPEVGNVLWKKVNRHEIDEEIARDIMASLLALGIEAYATKPLIDFAIGLACRFQCTVYDGLYLALAVEERSQLVTADRKFYDAMFRTALGEHLLWIEDA